MSVDASLCLRPSVFVRGTYEQRPILLVRAGIGREAMDRATRYLAERYRPRFCLHIGYCGGADPSLQAGDMVIANPVVDSATGEKFEPPSSAIDLAETLLSEMGIRHRSAGLVTVDEIAREPFDKAFLGTQHEAVAIDMESAALARACSAAGIPYVVVRAVLDPLDYEFPDLDGAVDESGKTDGVALASRLIRRPSDLLKLPKLEYLASQARQSITSLIEAWLRQEAS
jgi:adenosylhomocysteine nucleosidase